VLSIPPKQYRATKARQAHDGQARQEGRTKPRGDSHAAVPPLDTRRAYKHLDLCSDMLSPILASCTCSASSESTLWDAGSLSGNIASHLPSVLLALKYEGSARRESAWRLSDSARHHHRHVAAPALSRRARQAVECSSPSHAICHRFSSTLLNAISATRSPDRPAPAFQAAYTRHPTSRRLSGPSSARRASRATRPWRSQLPRPAHCSA
jgi:hypothetical protein